MNSIKTECISAADVDSILNGLFLSRSLLPSIFIELFQLKHIKWKTWKMNLC